MLFVVKRAAETRTFSVDMRESLLAGELLDGTPTVEEIGTSDLTISGVGLSVSPSLVVGKIFIPTDKAVLFTVAGGSAARSYLIRITVTTDATPAQTLVKDVTLRVN